MTRSSQTAAISPKDARAAAELADWLKGFDTGEVVVLYTWGKERFRVSWDKDKGLKIYFPQPKEEHIIERVECS